MEALGKRNEPRGVRHLLQALVAQSRRLTTHPWAGYYIF